MATLTSFSIPAFAAQVTLVGTRRSGILLFVAGWILLVATRVLQSFGDLSYTPVAPPPMNYAIIMAVFVAQVIIFMTVWLFAGIVLEEKTGRELAQQERDSAYTELDSAYRELSQNERFRTQFFANATHELKTPLVSVIGFLELFLGKKKPDQEEGLRLALNGANKLKHLVDDLTIAADPVSARNRMRAREIDLTPILEEESNLASGFSPDRELQISADLPGSLPAFADPDRVAQVARNLLVNAARFSPDGGTVILRGYREGENITITVTDEGPGFDEGLLPALFEEKYVRGRFKGDGQGMGIGLINCHTLVSSMRGKIAATNRPGGGAEVTFSLPVRDPSTQLAENSHTPRRALVLDDQPETLFLMENYLEMENFEPSLFENGTAAYEAALEKEFDLLLLDINVPGMSGIEICTKLKNFGYPGKIVLFSALIRSDADRLLSESGGDDFLEKPFSHDQFQRIIGT